MTPEIEDTRLYGILDLGYVAGRDPLEIARQMLLGGVQILQLRAKSAQPQRISALARELSPLCRAHQVPFLLNDHPELVPETGAQGAHVGQDDMSVAEARALAGESAVIGKSTHSLEQLAAAGLEKPDYVGFGPLFATPTKPDYPPIGLADIREAQRVAALPVFCIGGINLDNLSKVLEAGAQRVVIVSGILQAPDLRAYCEACRAVLAEKS
jgi:thiamine-phosphate pyrophosphorylase